MVKEMVKEMARISPLHNISSLQHNDLTLQELSRKSKWIIRADLADKEVIKIISDICGVAVPLACRLEQSQDKRLSWLAPDELLFYCQDELADIKKLQTALVNKHAALIEVSDYYTVLNLQGDKASEILNSEVTLDLRLKSFPVGACAGTLFANATILLSRIAQDSFDVQIRWSFAQYLWSHLADGIKHVG